MAMPSAHQGIIVQYVGEDDPLYVEARVVASINYLDPAGDVDGIYRQWKFEMESYRYNYRRVKPFCMYGVASWYVSYVDAWIHPVDYYKILYSMRKFRSVWRIINGFSLVAGVVVCGSRLSHSVTHFAWQLCNSLLPFLCVEFFFTSGTCLRAVGCPWWPRDERAMCCTIWKRCNAIVWTIILITILIMITAAILCFLPVFLAVTAVYATCAWAAVAIMFPVFMCPTPDHENACLSTWQLILVQRGIVRIFYHAGAWCVSCALFFVLDGWNWRQAIVSDWQQRMDASSDPWSWLAFLTSL